MGVASSEVASSEVASSEVASSEVGVLCPPTRVVTAREPLECPHSLTNTLPCAPSFLMSPSPARAPKKCSPRRWLSNYSSTSFLSLAFAKLAGLMLLCTCSSDELRLCLCCPQFLVRCTANCCTMAANMKGSASVIPRQVLFWAVLPPGTVFMHCLGRRLLRFRSQASLFRAHFLIWATKK